MRSHSKRFTILVLGMAALAVAPLRADEVRLLDGRVYCGKVAEDGKDVVVTTRDGVVRLAKKDVQYIRDAGTLERELGDLSARFGDTPFAHLQLARLARDWNLVDAMWVHADAACTRKHETLEGPLREFLLGCEPELLPTNVRKTPVENRVQELLWRVHREASPARVAAIVEILAVEPGAEAALRKKGRQATLEVQRMAALSALAKRESKSEDRFVWRTALLDPASKVREHSALLAKDHGRSADAITYLAGALDNDDSTIRIRAAEAFTRMADKGAIDPLVVAGPKAGDKVGASPRAHCAFLTQESYVRDFDVEVAQSAAIADPKVDLLQTGAVLDVAVHSVQIYRIEVVRAYRKALVALAGSDPGPDPATWAAWREKLAGKGTAPRTQRQENPAR